MQEERISELCLSANLSPARICLKVKARYLSHNTKSVYIVLQVNLLNNLQNLVNLSIILGLFESFLIFDAFTTFTIVKYVINISLHSALTQPHCHERAESSS